MLDLTNNISIFEFHEKVIQATNSGVIVKIPVSKCVNSSCNRSRKNQKRISEIAFQYDEKHAIVNPIKLNYRDGECRVVDGSHRVSAAILGNRNYIYAVIRLNLTNLEEKQWFDVINANTAVTIKDDYESSLGSGEPIALCINNIVASSGFKISTGSKAGNKIGSVKVLYEIYNMGNNILRDTLKTIKETWYYKECSTDSTVLKIVASFYERFAKSNTIDHTRLIQQLQKKYFNPVQLKSYHINNNKKNLRRTLDDLRDEYNGLMKTSAKLLCD